MAPVGGPVANTIGGPLAETMGGPPVTCIAPGNWGATAAAGGPGAAIPGRGPAAGGCAGRIICGTACGAIARGLATAAPPFAALPIMAWRETKGLATAPPRVTRDPAMPRGFSGTPRPSGRTPPRPRRGIPRPGERLAPPLRMTRAPPALAGKAALARGAGAAICLANSVEDFELH